MDGTSSPTTFDRLMRMGRKTDMKSHTITLKVTAPNRLSEQEVRNHLMKLIFIGKHDAAETLSRVEGDLPGAKDAMSLCIKLVEETLS